MKTYRIMVSYRVDARDEDEAREIAKVVARAVEGRASHPYLVREAETVSVEEE